VAEQLKRLIDLDFPITTDLSPLSAERQVHLDFAEVRRTLYIGRRSAFQWLSAHASAPCRITGEAGAGVSAFLANWVTDYELANPTTFVLTHFVDSSQFPTLASMLRRLLCELKEHFGLRRSVPSALAELVTEFPNWLADAAQCGPVLLLLDAVDRLDDHRQFRWLPVLFPKFLFPDLVATAQLFSRTRPASRSSTGPGPHSGFQA
jgi:nephrocystin-3